MKKLSIIIVLQIFIIIFLYEFILNAKKQVLGDINVNPIKKEAITFPKETELKYYFENKSNSTYTEPLMSWLHSPVTYHYNNDGFNNIKDYSIEKPVTTYLIIALGDSFTQGMFVDTSKNWVSLLEQQINSNIHCPDIHETELLNLGVSGHDIQYALETYKRKGAKYNPDLIIWFLKVDDFTDINELMRANQEKYTDELKASGKYDELVKKGTPYPFSPMLIEDMNNLRKSLGEDYIFSRQKEFIKEFLSIYPKKILFITMPFGDSRYREYLKELALNHSNINYFELTNTINSKEYSFYPNDVHPNEKGHQLISDELLNYLLQNNILSCK